LARVGDGGKLTTTATPSEGVGGTLEGEREREREMIMDDKGRLNKY
jgi:hypothetical protein